MYTMVLKVFNYVTYVYSRAFYQPQNGSFTKKTKRRKIVFADFKYGRHPVAYEIYEDWDRVG